MTMMMVKTNMKLLTACGSGAKVETFNGSGSMKFTQMQGKSGTHKGQENIFKDGDLQLSDERNILYDVVLQGEQSVV